MSVPHIGQWVNVAAHVAQVTKWLHGNITVSLCRTRQTLQVKDSVFLDPGDDNILMLELFKALELLVADWDRPSGVLKILRDPSWGGLSFVGTDGGAGTSPSLDSSWILPSRRKVKGFFSPGDSCRPSIFCFLRSLISSQFGESLACSSQGTSVSCQPWNPIPQW